jgi:hypothetical protein
VAPGACIYPGGLDQYGSFHDAGTLGMGVVGPGGEMFGLTAAHVVGGLSAAHDGEPTEVVLMTEAAPGAGDPGLGFVHSSDPPEPCDDIAIDASLVRLEPHVEAGHVLREHGTNARPVDLGTIPKDEEILVFKRGMRVPHMTTGFLKARRRSLKIPVAGGCDREYVRGYYVQGAEDGTPFAKPGDSGSIVVDEDDCVVGMVVAVRLSNPTSWTPGPDDPAFVVAMTDILEALDFQLLGAARPCTVR